MNIELGAIQERFADIIWEHEPVASGELVRICEKELNWKKPTMYTVLRKLCEKGIFLNQNGIVTSLVSREDFYAAKSAQIIEESYQGPVCVIYSDAVAVLHRGVYFPAKHYRRGGRQDPGDDRLL